MINYDKLPFLYINKKESLSKQTKDDFYKLNADLMTENRVEVTNHFLSGRFLVSGKNYILPEYVASPYAKKHFIYPIAFLILNGDSRYYTERDSLNCYELRYTLEGEGTLNYEGKTYHLAKGEGFLIDCRKHHHYYTVGDSWKCTVFHFDGIPVMPYMDAYFNRGSVKFTENIIPGYEMMQMQILQKMLTHTVYREYKISCLFHLLLTELLSETGPMEEHTGKSEVIQNIISYMGEHYSDNITIEMLLPKFGISRTHLDREFRKYTGFSPKEYLIQIRINHAKLLLKSSSYSVEQISGMVGFNNSAHFVQMFKKLTDTTPLQYRKLNMDLS
ncbi:AraC family transcriptional regulator [Lachnospiraceae bacterium OttesenSCG-928-D06]|nr:AraC family transcriptional regulator [Lachnospiraceae bacterium OttesenSCG-928-D06]